MKHHSEKDPAWKANGLSISYSGPALLVVREKDKTVYERKILFVKGEPKQIETADGTMEEAPLRLFAAGTAGPLSEEELFYEIKPGQEAFLRIEAGSRVFESVPWKEEDKTEVTVLPPRVLVLELIDDASEAEHEFEASAVPKKPHLFEWDFGDGSPVVEDRKGPGENSVRVHRFTGLKPEILSPPPSGCLTKKEGPRGRFRLRHCAQGEKRHFFENRTFWMTGSPGE